MKTLKRSECAVLPLVLKKQWYDMIDRGEKRIEYREAKPYWIRRIANWCRRMDTGVTPVLEFRCGYRAGAPTMAFVAGVGNGAKLIYDYRTASDPVQHPDIGEFPGARYCLFIGERVEWEGETKSEGAPAPRERGGAVSTSPRPWCLDDSDTIRDANGCVVVSALNPCGYETRRLVRRFVDLFTPGTIHPAGTMERLLREARAAIGEDKQ